MISSLSQTHFLSSKEIDEGLRSRRAKLESEQPKVVLETKYLRDPKRIPKSLLTEEGFAKNHVSLFALYPELAPYKIVDFHHKDNRNEIHHQIFPAIRSLSVFDIQFIPKKWEKVS